MELSVQAFFEQIGYLMGVIFQRIWWIILPAIAISWWWRLFVGGNKFFYARGLKWVLLRIRTPRDVKRTPQSMERIFAAMHSTYSFGFDWWDKNIVGKSEDAHSFEIVGDAMGVSMYARIQEKYRPMFESAVYAEYPDAEIEKVDDYTKELPVVVPNSKYDLFGADIVLAADNAYPINTYKNFDLREPEEKIDTISTLLELMSRLSGDERIWFQMILKPTGDEWKKNAEEERDKVINRKATKKKKKSFTQEVWEFIKVILKFPFTFEVKFEEEKPKEEEKVNLAWMTDGEKERVRAIEEKIAKLGFETEIRFLYIASKTSFNGGNISAMMSIFRQYNSLNLNGFKPNMDTLPILRGHFKHMEFEKSRRLHSKKRNLYEGYIRRRPEKKLPVLNTEELASLYHFPTEIVVAPGLQSIDFRRGTPPTNLPT
ncbi:MAG: hypothetical protein FJY91_01640 [Candidatus Harrisonbacteria bacterium]|nr:hypothetical protein [Candidatus Harrisonbacteria bacterium]